jgi:hypothetical protein
MIKADVTVSSVVYEKIGVIGPTLANSRMVHHNFNTSLAEVVRRSNT